MFKHIQNGSVNFKESFVMEKNPLFWLQINSTSRHFFLHLLNNKKVTVHEQSEKTKIGYIYIYNGLEIHKENL